MFNLLRDDDQLQHSPITFLFDDRNISIKLMEHKIAEISPTSKFSPKP